MRTAGSIFFASQWAAAFSRIEARFSSAWMNGGTDASYIVIFIGFSGQSWRGKRKPHSSGATVRK